jgi:hypothetical protein
MSVQWKRWIGEKGVRGKEGRKKNQIRTFNIMQFSFCDLPWHFSLLILVLELD